MSFDVQGFAVPAPIVVLGVVTGVTYGVLAVGLVLVYRSSKVINFAHGEIGAVGAAVLGTAIVRWHIPYWVSFLFALCVSASLGALTEVAVVRRLRNAPKLMSLVATLGVAQFLLLVSSTLNSQVTSGTTFPEPAGMPEFHLGALFFTPARTAMLVVGPLIVVSLAVFLTRNKYGLAIRGAAANPERARLSGIFAGRTSGLAWAIAGTFAAFTAIVIIPTRGFITTETLGPSLLLRALVAAVIARMENLPTALGAGVAIGVIDGLVLFNYPAGALPEAIMFGLVLCALLFQSRRGSRERDQGEVWAAVQPWPPLSGVLRRIFAVREMGKILLVAGLVIGVLLGFVVTNAAAVTLTTILAFSLVGLSLGVVTGLAGQLSLGQFALAGVGAMASALVVLETGNFIFGFIVAALAGAATSTLIGLPALRIKGLMLAVTTLSFALAGQWLFQQSWAIGGGLAPGRPILGSLALDTSKRYFFFALVVFVLGFAVAANVWRSGFGLRLRAVRDNEDAARSFGLSATHMKLEAFVLGGVLAGIGGAVYGHSLSRINGAAFDVSTSLSIVALTVLGGIGLLTGPLLGAVYIVGVPAFLPLDSAGLAATALGWLLIVLYFPGGIAQMISPIRARLISLFTKGADTTAEAETFDAVPLTWTGATPRTQTPGPAASKEAKDEVLLAARNLTKRYGGVVAVADVSFEVRSGEVLGLMGPNGAGKTTTFELISGFTPTDDGDVEFAGQVISGLTPERRTHLGLVRSFQDVALFPTLTVVEAVALALQLKEPCRFVPSVLGINARANRHKERAGELIEMMGLPEFGSKQIRELSTGTRRITELACMVALEPRLLLLDEPSSGIAQRETEALGELLENLRRSLDITLVIIEHDIPLLMGLSDRVVVMDAGEVIAEGPPKAIQQDVKVIAAYLGADTAVLERSGQRSSNGSKCRATTQSGSSCRRKAVANGLCTQHLALQEQHA